MTVTSKYKGHEEAEKKKYEDILRVSPFLNEKFDMESLHRYGETYGSPLMILGNGGTSSIRVSKHGKKFLDDELKLPHGERVKYISQ